MPTYDVTYLVSYRRMERVDAPDEDEAAERAHDRVRTDIPVGRYSGRIDVSLYSCEVARKDDDA